MSVARNIIKHPKLLPGGGAAELTVSATLKQKIEKWPYEAAAIAFEAIPRFCLFQGSVYCGLNVIRTMTTLQGKHANGENAWIGIDGNTGEISDMKERKVAGHFTYGVMALSAATFLFWNLFGAQILPVALHQGNPVSLALQLSCGVLG